MLVVRYFSKYELRAPTTAMRATAAIAKFSIAYGLLPNMPETAEPSQPGSFFDWSTLSTTILMGQGSSMSVMVSPNTAARATMRVFQCGRMRSPIFSVRGCACFTSFMVTQMMGWGCLKRGSACFRPRLRSTHDENIHRRTDLRHDQRRRTRRADERDDHQDESRYQ